MLTPEKSDMVMDIVMDYITERKLWKIQYICGRLLAMLLESNIYSGDVLNLILNHIRMLQSQEHGIEPKEVNYVLHQVLKSDVWSTLRAVDMNLLLTMYHESVLDASNPKLSIRTALENCFQKIFQVVSAHELMQLLVTMIPLALDTNLDEMAALKFGNTTIDAALWYKKKSKSFKIPLFVFEYLLEAIASNDANKSFLACKILSRLLDTNQNYNEFMCPKIFHFYTTYNIEISQMTHTEWQLFLEYHSKFEDSITYAIKRHGLEKNNLNVIYTTLCEVIVSTPTGKNAGLVVCLLMNIQKLGIDLNVEQKFSNHIHAVVISLMTLFTWVHRGQSLLKYVDSIRTKRLVEAPHLMPPLKVS